MRPYCTQALPNCRAARTSLQAAGSAGAFQRSAPTGGAAYGTPFHDQVPLAASALPSTRP